MIANVTDRELYQRYTFGSIDMNPGELRLYAMRHVQHHAALLNLILRQKPIPCHAGLAGRICDRQFQSIQLI